MKKSKNIKYLLFDFDGTVADSLGHVIDVMNRIRFLFGYDKINVEDPEFARHTDNNFATDYLKLNPLQFKIWLRLLKIGMLLKAPRIRLFRGMKSALKKIEPHYPIGILTSAPFFYTQHILKNNKISGIDTLIANAGYATKDQSLRKFLKQKNLKANQVLYVGDEVRDGHACQKIKMPFAAVEWGKDALDLLKETHPLVILKNPRDLIEALDL